MRIALKPAQNMAGKARRDADRDLTIRPSYVSFQGPATKGGLQFHYDWDQGILGCWIDLPPVFGPGAMREFWVDRLCCDRNSHGV